MTESPLKVSRIRLVKDADLIHCFYFSSVDGGFRVQESIQTCSSFLELIYNVTPSRYILGTVRASQTQFAPKTIPDPPDRPFSLTTFILYQYNLCSSEPWLSHQIMTNDLPQRHNWFYLFEQFCSERSQIP